jgi:hypothetical protein
LPDGIFSNQKFKIGYILEGLEMESVGIFNGFLTTFNDHLVYFANFGIFHQEKSGNPETDHPKLS